MPPTTKPRPRAESVLEQGLQGTVKFYNQQKGWGCVIADDGREIYVNWRHVITQEFKPLEPGIRVRFDVAHSDRPSGAGFAPGVCAVNVEKD
ncbi:MAG TPA: cold shock domain-containing protein [Candidatus Acidoferrum sp.]|nr:cold shock domain-containing protein [Candidatus Acidoferrum sp.]